MALLTTKDPTFDERGQRIPHRNSKARRVIAGPEGQLVDDLARGRLDKVFFSKRFLGIEEHPGQVRFSVAATMRSEDGYSPAFADIALVSGNQAGKTLELATTIFHQTFYKLGIEGPNPADTSDVHRWARDPFHWYHISHEGKIANIAHTELVSILTGSHRAQKGRGCPLVDEFGPIVEWDRKDLGEYPWIRVHPGFGGGEIHFRHTNEKAKALLGLVMNGISYDEAAFELYLPEIREEVLHLRRLTTGGPIFWISTGTEGYNAFADLWEEGNPANPYRHPQSLSLRMSTRDNIGFGITQKQFDDRVSTMDPRLIPQNIDGQFIGAVESYFFAETVEAAFLPDLPDDAAPEKGHRYVQGVDPASGTSPGSDATWVAVFDYTDKPIRAVRARRRAGQQAQDAIVNMIRESSLLYNAGGSCATIMDDTAMGGKLFRKALASVVPHLRGYDFAGTKAKRIKILSDLKTVIDRGGVVFPRHGVWLDLRRQLLGYRLDDKKLETDAVFAVALAVHHASRNPEGGVVNPRLDFFGLASSD